MALDWLPGLADAIPRRRWPPVKPWEDLAAIAVPTTIPVPDILHTTWFLTLPPDRIPTRRPPVRELTEVTAPDSSITSPLAWAPTLPSRRPPLPIFPVRDRAEVAPIPYEVIIAGLRAWEPGLATSRPIAHPILDTTQISIGPPPPPVPVPGGPCVEWGLQTSEATDLLSESATVSDLLHEGLATSTLLNEDLC